MGNGSGGKSGGQGGGGGHRGGSTRDLSPNDDRSTVKNPNSDPYDADQANRVKQAGGS